MTTTTTRVTLDGRSYEVTLDSDKINAPLGSYAEVTRIRADGGRGRRITTLSIIFAVVRAAEAADLRVADIKAGVITEGPALLDAALNARFAKKGGAA